MCSIGLFFFFVRSCLTYYCPPTEWRRLSFQSCVSVCLSVHRGVPTIRGSKAPPHVQISSGWTSLHRDPPRHIQLVHYVACTSRKMASWHSTEMPSCYCPQMLFEGNVFTYVFLSMGGVGKSHALWDW